MNRGYLGCPSHRAESDQLQVLGSWAGIAERFPALWKTLWGFLPPKELGHEPVSVWVHTAAWMV